MPLNPRLIVLCGPSGSGKSTLLKRILTEHPDQFGFSVSHTTRMPRFGEVDGKDYNFVSREIMEIEIKSGKFVEHAEFSGTSMEAVKSVLNSGRNVILDIDMQGVQQLQRICSKSNPYTSNPLYIFIAPPSLQTLEQRLRMRGSESEDAVLKRLEAAQSELAWAKQERSVDAVIVNEIIEDAYQEFLNCIFSAK